MPGYTSPIQETEAQRNSTTNFSKAVTNSSFSIKVHSYLFKYNSFSTIKVEAISAATSKKQVKLLN